MEAYDLSLSLPDPGMLTRKRSSCSPSLLCGDFCELLSDWSSVEELQALRHSQLRLMGSSSNDLSRSVEDNWRCKGR